MSYKLEEIGKVCDLINGRGFKTSEWSKEGLPIVRIQNLNDFDKPFNYYSGDFSQNHLIDDGQLLFSWSGTPGTSFGAFFWNRGKALLNQHIFKVVIYTKKVNSNYLRLILNYSLNKIIGQAHGGVGLKHITKGKLEKTKIPLPPLEDQKKIAHILSRVESLINQRRESLKKLDDLLKSTFLEMFGDPVKNEKGWDKNPLEEFGEIKTGNTPPRKDPQNYSDKFIEWIKTDNIVSKYLYVTRASEFLSEKGLEKGRTVNEGALLVACIAGSLDSIGRAVLTNRKVAFNQQINAIQPNKEVDSYFLYGLFNICKKYIQNQATKGMKKIITKGVFNKILMIKPPIDIQKRYAKILIRIESLKSKYQNSLCELENLYGSLSQKAFKGELDLSKVKILKPVNDLIEEKEKYSSVRIDLSPLRETFKSFQEFLSSFKTYFDNNSEKINNFIIKLHESTVYFESLSYVIKNKEKLTSSKFDAAYMEGLTSIDSEESIESLIKFILKILGDLEQKYLSNIISGYFESNDKAELSCAEKVEYLEKSIFRNIEQYKLFNALLIQELQPNEKLDVFKIYLTKHLKQKALSFEEINDQMIKDKVKGFFPFRFLKTVLLELDKHDEPWIKQSFGRFVEDHSNETEDSVVFELI